MFPLTAALGHCPEDKDMNIFFTCTHQNQNRQFIY